jgi:hypothetical protein
MEVRAIPLDTPRVLMPPAFLEQGALHGHRRGPRYRGHADGWDVLAFADPVLADTATTAVRGRHTTGWAYEFGARGGGAAGSPS